MLVRFIFQRLKRILQHLENNFWMKMYLKSKMVWMYQEGIKSHQNHQDHPSKASKVCIEYNVLHISRKYSMYTHVMGCDTFGPKPIWTMDIWSPTIGPQLIGPYGQTVPNQFSPDGQMVPKNSVPMDKWSPTNLSRGTGSEDPEIRGPNWLWTICPG